MFADQRWHNHSIPPKTFEWMKLSLLILMFLLVAQIPALSAETNKQSPAGKVYNFTDSVTSGGLRRTYTVHVPPGYNRATKIPLVIVFHGLGMNGKMMIFLTNFNVESDRKTFAVVYPDAAGARWNDGMSGGADDITFVDQMLNRISTYVNVDQRRIYGVGMSNGGHFVQRLACVYPRIAAIGVVAATMTEAAARQCNDRRVPAIFFLGTDDPLVPSNDSGHNEQLGKLGQLVGLGGLDSLSAPIARMGGIMSAEETVEFWCHHNQSPTSPYTNQEPDVDSHDGTRVTKMDYGSYSNEVLYYRITGGGHTWPGAFYSGARDVMGRTTGDINATQLIADFFLRH